MFSLDVIMDAFDVLDGTMTRLDALNSAITSKIGLDTYFSNGGYTLNIEGRIAKIKIESTGVLHGYIYASNDSSRRAMFYFQAELEEMLKD